MHWHLYQSKLKRVLRHRSLFIRFLFAQCLLIGLLILALIYAFSNQRIVIIPAVVDRAFWVSHTEVSDVYLAEMSHFLIGLRFNLSPANADLQQDILLRYTDTRYYATLKAQLSTEAEKIRKDRISLSFYPVDINVNVSTLTAQITGNLISSVGSVQQLPLRIRYQLHYRFHQGRLLIQSFEELKIP